MDEIAPPTPPSGLTSVYSNMLNEHLPSVKKKKKKFSPWLKMKQEK